MTRLQDLTALELASAIRRREVSPLEVLDHTLSRIEELNDSVGAFVTVTEELAREQALTAAGVLQRASSDDDLPPFLGVPCPVKDLAMVAGVPFHAGSAVFSDMTAPVDDGVVTLLKRAGTLMVGKTNTPEFGLPAYTEPDIAPPARTPWDARRSAGGSSGGAAAAVAAGIVPVAHGSDGGGSLRIPASACGLVGLKPTRGRVSAGPHSVDGVGLVSNGVLTRDVRDSAAFLDVLAKPWPGETYVLAEPSTSFLDACGRPPQPLRIGLLTQPVIDPTAHVDSACLEAVHHTGELLESMGHHVEQASVPFPASRWEGFEALWSVGSLLAPVSEEHEHLLVPLTRWLRDKGRRHSASEYAEALILLQQTTRETAAAWADFDVIVSPTLARPPEVVGGLRDDADPAADFAAQMAYTPWTSVWNLTGWPAISLPLETTRVDGSVLPIGVMLGAKHGREDLLFSLSAQLEEANPWKDRHPTLVS